MIRNVLRLVMCMLDLGVCAGKKAGNNSREQWSWAKAERLKSKFFPTDLGPWILGTSNGEYKASFTSIVGCYCSGASSSFVVKRNRSNQNQTPTQNWVGVSEIKAMKSSMESSCFLGGIVKFWRPLWVATVWKERISKYWMGNEQHISKVVEALSRGLPAPYWLEEF